MKIIFQTMWVFFLLPVVACGQKSHKVTKTKVFQQMNASEPTKKGSSSIDTATFAAGCFWCVEAQFSTLKGVKKVVSGFEGGHTANPTYREVCTGTTGYAETCNIFYDPSIISYKELLSAFFVAHDPTQLNRQGNDVGTQYRSVIFYHNQKQQKLANFYIKKLNKVHAYPNKIVTKVVASSTFYPAKDHHQQFYEKNPNQAYCHYVIQPELKRFKKVFREKLKDSF